MGRNILGILVPEEIEQKAKEHGCVGGILYVYQDNQYGGNPPRASIGCERAVPFRTGDWDRSKVYLGPGWVAFRSPSSSKRQPGGQPCRVSGKESCEPCLVCGEDRFTEAAHFPTPDRHGGVDTIWLCPTHHRLLDNGRLSDWELMEIRRKKYPELAIATAKEFVEWAYKNKYPYSFDHMQQKSVRKNYTSRG
jgi:hypothetical protein